MPVLRGMAQEGEPVSMLQRRDKAARERWVSGLTRPACRDCPARPGQWCDPLHPPPAEMVLIDRDPPHQIHSTRIADAVTAGHVSRKITIAQFAGGPVAAGL